MKCSVFIGQIRFKSANPYGCSQSVLLKEKKLGTTRLDNTVHYFISHPSPEFEGNPEEEENNKAEGKEDGEVAVLGAPANEAKTLHAPLQKVARLEELVILPTQGAQVRL